MRFSCGRTNEQKAADREVWLAQQNEWHKVFLLRPRTLEEKDGKKICYWLQWVERKMAQEDYYWRDHYVRTKYEYRVVQK